MTKRTVKRCRRFVKLDRIIWVNLACLCVAARRQEDIGCGG
jgi:hypothetical protein